MKMSKNQFLIKVSFDEQPAKIYINRKQSLQMDRTSPQSLDKTINQNYLSSYPILKLTKSKVLCPLINQQNCQSSSIERKKSPFLKNYNQKLKRQRKRQSKLKSSIQQLKNYQPLPNLTQTLNYHDQFIQNYANTNFSTTLTQHQQRGSSILVFRKTPFLDTSSSLFKQKKDYSKDLSLQLLLKEINDIRNEQKKEIQRINQQKKTIQKQYRKTKKNSTNQQCFTDYERGFLLPMRRRMTLRNGTLSRTSDLFQGSTNQLIKENSKQKTQPHKQTSQRKRLDKFYNFKHIDPWENPSHRQQNHSLDSHPLFSSLQYLS